MKVYGVSPCCTLSKSISQISKIIGMALKYVLQQDFNHFSKSRFNAVTPGISKSKTAKPPVFNEWYGNTVLSLVWLWRYLRYGSCGCRELISMIKSVLKFTASAESRIKMILHPEHGCEHMIIAKTSKHLGVVFILSVLTFLWPKFLMMTVIDHRLYMISLECIWFHLNNSVCISSKTLNWTAIASICYFLECFTYAKGAQSGLNAICIEKREFELKKIVKTKMSFRTKRETGWCIYKGTSKGYDWCINRETD